MPVAPSASTVPPTNLAVNNKAGSLLSSAPPPSASTQRQFFLSLPSESAKGCAPSSALSGNLGQEEGGNDRTCPSYTSAELVTATPQQHLFTIRIPSKRLLALGSSTQQTEQERDRNTNEEDDGELCDDTESESSDTKHDLSAAHNAHDFAHDDNGITSVPLPDHNQGSLNTEMQPAKSTATSGCIVKISYKQYKSARMEQERQADLKCAASPALISEPLSESDAPLPLTGESRVNSNLHEDSAADLTKDVAMEKSDVCTALVQNANSTIACNADKCDENGSNHSALVSPPSSSSSSPLAPSEKTAITTTITMAAMSAAVESKAPASPIATNGNTNSSFGIDCLEGAQMIGLLQGERAEKVKAAEEEEDGMYTIPRAPSVEHSAKAHPPTIESDNDCKKNGEAACETASCAHLVVEFSCAANDDGEECHKGMEEKAVSPPSFSTIIITDLNNSDGKESCPDHAALLAQDLPVTLAQADRIDDAQAVPHCNGNNSGVESVASPIFLGTFKYAPYEPLPNFLKVANSTGGHFKLFIPAQYIAAKGEPAEKGAGLWCCCPIAAPTEADPECYYTDDSDAIAILRHAGLLGCMQQSAASHEDMVACFEVVHSEKLKADFGGKLPVNFPALKKNAVSSLPWHSKHDGAILRLVSFGQCQRQSSSSNNNKGAITHHYFGWRKQAQRSSASIAERNFSKLQPSIRFSPILRTPVLKYSLDQATRFASIFEGSPLSSSVLYFEDCSQDGSALGKRMHDSTAAKEQRHIKTFTLRQCASNKKYIFSVNGPIARESSSEALKSTESSSLLSAKTASLVPVASTRYDQLDWSQLVWVDGGVYFQGRFFRIDWFAWQSQ